MSPLGIIYCQRYGELRVLEAQLVIIRPSYNIYIYSCWLLSRHATGIYIDMEKNA